MELSVGVAAVLVILGISAVVFVSLFLAELKKEREEGPKSTKKANDIWKLVGSSGQGDFYVDPQSIEYLEHDLVKLFVRVHCSPEEKRRNIFYAKLHGVYNEAWDNLSHTICLTIIDFYEIKLATSGTMLFTYDGHRLDSAAVASPEELRWLPIERDSIEEKIYCYIKECSPASLGYESINNLMDMVRDRVKQGEDEDRTVAGLKKRIDVAKWECVDSGGSNIYDGIYVAPESIRRVGNIGDGESIADAIKPAPAIIRATWALSRGIKLVDDEQYKDAIVELDRALDAFGEMGTADIEDVAQAYLSRGFAYYSCNNHDQAIKDYTQVLDLVPNETTALLQRGLAHFTVENHEEAIVDYNAALKIDSSDHKAMMLRGMAYYAKGDLHLSIADLETVLQVDPDNSGARQVLESAHYKLKGKH